MSVHERSYVVWNPDGHLHTHTKTIPLRYNRYRLPYFTNVTVAPITTTPRISRTQVPVGSENGIDHESFVNCDDIQTIPKARVLSRIGQLTIEQEARLTDAIHTAFDLSQPLA